MAEKCRRQTSGTARKSIAICWGSLLRYLGDQFSWAGGFWPMIVAPGAHQSGCSLAFAAGGVMLPAASKNHAANMHQDEFPVRPGIGNEIGNAARMPSIARQPAITNRATFGARNIEISSADHGTSVPYDGKALLIGETDSPNLGIFWLPPKR
jgi:hypothetical protein